MARRLVWSDGESTSEAKVVRVAATAREKRFVDCAGSGALKPPLWACRQLSLHTARLKSARWQKLANARGVTDLTYVASRYACGKHIVLNAARGQMIQDRVVGHIQDAAIVFHRRRTV